MGVCAVCVCALWFSCGVRGDSSDWASTVIEYVRGQNGVPAYTNPLAALGEAAQMTTDDLSSNMVPVQVFQPPYLPEQIVSVGNGGRLTLAFSPPVMNEDDPVHPHGADMIIYGNALFAYDSEAASPYNTPWLGMSAERGDIWVSADGEEWLRVTNRMADALMPTQSLDLEGGPSDYLTPVAPWLFANDWFDGTWRYTNTVAAYDGAAGGAPVDLSALADAQGVATALAYAAYIRITDPQDAASTEIDAVARVASVPEAWGAAFIVHCSWFIVMLKARRREVNAGVS